MFVIFKRELRTIFSSIKNVSCIALLAAVSGFLFTFSNMSAGNAEIYSILSSMTLFAAVIIPVLVCDTFVREKESRAFLSALPITASGLLFGKGFAFLVLVLIANAPLFLFPIILGLMGGPALGTAYPALLIFILFECFIIALSLLFATLFRKLWKLWVVLYAILVASFVIGAAAILLSASVGDIVRLVSPFKQTDHIVFGTFDMVAVLYYLTFTALFLWLAVCRVRRALSGVRARRKANVRRAVLAAVVAVVCVVANVAAVFIPLEVRQFDTSANRIYSISDNTKSFLKAIDKDVNVYLINAVGMATLGNFIERYCELSEHISFKEINTTDDAELIAKYGISTENVANYSMILDSGDRYKYITPDQYFCYLYNDSYFSTLVFENAYNQYSTYYNAYVQAGQTSSSEFQQIAQTYQSMMSAKMCIAAEDTMTEAIAYVTADKVPTIYFADGNGEQSTGNRINLKTDKVPENATLIVINTPKEDYSDEVVADLLNFTKRGGRLIALTNEENIEMPNLMRLLECYGISAKAGALGDGLTANIDASQTTFLSGGFSEIKLDGTYELVAKEIDGIETASLLTVSVSAPAEEDKTEEDNTTEEDEKKESTVTKNVGMISYENDVPKLLWISGGGSFYKTSEDIAKYDIETDEGKDMYSNYTNLLSFLQISMLAMKENFDSGLSYPSPKQFSTDILAVDAGDATLMGVIFIVLYPLAVVGTAFMLSYARKKKSQAALEQARQA